MRSFCRSTRRAILASLAATATVRPALAADVRTFTIGTGDPSGTYYPVGGLLAEIVSAPPGGNPCRPGEPCGVAGLVAVAQSSSGSIANLEGLVTGRFDSAFCQADVAQEAWRGGTILGQGPLVDVRALASLYPEHAHLVVADAAPWPPRRLAVGTPRSGTHLTTGVTLSAYGLDAGALEPVAINQSDALVAMADGAIDGFLTVAGLPNLAVAEALGRGGARLAAVDLEALRATLVARPHWHLSTIQPAVYGLDAPVASIAVSALWLARADLDEALVQALLSALWSPAARSLLDGGHPAARAISIHKALTGISVPLHAGADLFYREAGLLVGRQDPRSGG